METDLYVFEDSILVDPETHAFHMNYQRIGLNPFSWPFFLIAFVWTSAILPQSNKDIVKNNGIGGNYPHLTPP